MAGRLVLIDFDGTITRRDTLIEFIRFYHGTFRFLAGLALLSPVLVAYRLKWMANDKAKQAVLRFFFANTPEENFNRRCAEFAATAVPGLVKTSARELISNELHDGSQVAVVSASPENWVKPWCDTLGIPCLATRLEVVDGRITGKIRGKNCHGEEKSRRIRETFQLEKFAPIVAYGDSPGDRPMFALAHESHYRSLA